MKLCRFLHPSSAEPRYGIMAGDTVCPVTPDEYLNPGGAPRSQAVVPLSEIRLLSPVTPSKIVCVGRNYREHAAELGNKMPEEPLLFLKAPSALIGPEDAIELPPQSVQVEHEGELGVVIGRTAHRLQADEDPLAGRGLCRHHSGDFRCLRKYRFCHSRSLRFGPVGFPSG